MLISLAVAVIFINYFIEEWSEGIVRIVGASVDADARLSPLAAGVDGLSKCESILIFLVLELFPKLGSEAASEERLGACGEVRKVSNLLGTLKVGADKSSSGVSFSNLQIKQLSFWITGRECYTSGTRVTLRVLKELNLPGLRRFDPYGLSFFKILINTRTLSIKDMTSCVSLRLS